MLVIDDEADIRLLVRFVLEPAGHRVEEASTGREGLDALAGGGYDLVLLDLRLPDMEGWELLRAWRRGPGDGTKVVVMSAHASPSTFERAHLEGATGYVVKPFREEDLLRWV